MTIALKYEIKGEGIDKLLKALPPTISNIYIIFVVSEAGLNQDSKI